MKLPWWTKIGAKLVLSRVPLGYAIWRRLGIFRRGTMDRPDYALDVFRRHFERARFARKADSFVALELGPGDSVVSALIAAAHGAERTYLVDTGDYASRRMSVYRAMARRLRSERGSDLPMFHADDFDEMLHECGGIYLTDAIASLRTIPTASVDFVWSQAVLEHVRLSDFSELNHELRRVLRDDGVCSHRIDLGDHLGGALNHLRFSARIWESEFFARSGFYTNRLRYSEILRHFESASFAVEVLATDRWPTLPTRREALAHEFRRWPCEELRIRSFDAILRPLPST